MAGHGPVLSFKQLGRLGRDLLRAVLGRVLLCRLLSALKVLQLALKVLYERRASEGIHINQAGETAALRPGRRPSATGRATILSDKKCAVPRWIGTKK